MARYYILGDALDMKPVGPIKKWGRGATMNREDSEVKRLVRKIALDIWEADHEAMILAVEDYDTTPIADRSRYSSQSSANYINCHMNLVAISTAVTPPEQRKKRAHAKKLRETESSYTTSGITRPETAEELSSLDLSSRGAIAGLQMGWTKVFLRRGTENRLGGDNAGRIPPPGPVGSCTGRPTALP
jgi:hypothetical protein